MHRDSISSLSTGRYDKEVCLCAEKSVSDKIDMPRNSTYLQDMISGGKYNQLSTAKIQQLPFPRIDFSSAKEKALYLDIIGNINEVLKITRGPKRQMSLDTEKMIQNVEVQINMLVLDLWRLINSN